MIINAKTRPRRLDNLKVYSLWDEMVIYAPNQEKTFSLNPSAKAIWDLCDGKQTIAEISQSLGQYFDSSVKQLQDDVATTVLQLNGFGLLELINE
jgi:hypothetical protein